MSKSTKKHYEKMPGNEQYFQSAAFNSRIYMWYRQWIMSIAVNRFRWINLPETCDERYLELSLFFEGSATIAHPKDAPGLFYSTMAAAATPPNVYDNPTRWQSIGNNGWQFEASGATGVYIYDNRLRLPVAGHCDMLARRLTNLDRTLDINMLQQRTPYIITGPQEKVLDIANVCKQIAGGEPAIVGYSQLSDSVKVDAINTGVPILADEIARAKESLWGDIYRFLGMGAVSEKAERLVTLEAEMQREPAEIMALDPLGARRAACDAFNLRFRPEKPLQVVWNTDYLSNTYEFSHDAQLRAQLGGDANA